MASRRFGWRVYDVQQEAQGTRLMRNGIDMKRCGVISGDCHSVGGDNQIGRKQSMFRMKQLQHENDIQ